MHSLPNDRLLGVVRGCFGVKLTIVSACFMTSFHVTAGNDSNDFAYSHARIDELVVTATRRERPASTLPLSVNVLTAGDLDAGGVSDLQSLAVAAPTFNLISATSEAQGTSIQIRNVGTAGTNPGLESAVGVYIDGVYRSRSAIAYTELGPLERVEILRGPQSTLFGQNTTAGLINIITPSPAAGPASGYVGFGFGNYQSRLMEFGVNGGSEMLAAGVDALLSRRDGFFEDDALSARDYNTRDRYFVKSQVVWSPASDFRVRIISDIGRRDERCCNAMYIQKGLRTTYALEAVNPNRTDTSDTDKVFARKTYTASARNLNTSVDDVGVSAQLDWEFGSNLHLTSVSAYRDWHSESGGNFSFSGADLIYRNPEDSKQIFRTVTQEIRLNGDAGKLDWLMGLYFVDEDIDTTLSNKVGADYSQYVENTLGMLADIFNDLPLGTTTVPLQGLGISTNSGDGANDKFALNNRSVALFTHNSWQLNSEFTLVFGWRYTDEKKRVHADIDTFGAACDASLQATGFAGSGSSIVPTLGGLTTTELALMCLGNTLNSTLDGQYADKITGDNSSGTLSLSYTPAKNVHYYGSYSKGYKSGGYNLDRAGLDADTVLAGGIGATEFGINRDVEALRFDPEKVSAYELGVKSIFYGLKVDKLTVGANAALFYERFSDYQLNTFNGLTFNVVNLSDVISKGAEVDLFAEVGGNTRIRTGLIFAHTQYDDDLSGTAGVDLSAFAGKYVTHAPKLSMSAAIDHRWPVGDWQGFLHLDLLYRGAHNTGSDLDPEKQQDAYALINGSVGLESANRKWVLTFWSRNITDEDYYTVIFDTPLQNSPGIQPLESYSAFLGDPCTWGVSLDYHF